jgi:hypothetical protein
MRADGQGGNDRAPCAVRKRVPTFCISVSYH